MKLKLTLSKILIWLALLSFCTTIFAADPAPLAILKSASSQMITQLNRNIGRLKGNYRLVNSLVRRILLPHFDLVTMSRSVVGNNNWQQASSVTQQEFIYEFTNYVLSTYSSALQSYDGEKIIFDPMRSYSGSDARVQIDSSIMHHGAPPIRVQYRMIKLGGTWKIYDFSIDGISIVQNYRSQFAGILRQGNLATLVQQLKRRNSGR